MTKFENQELKEMLKDGLSIEVRCTADYTKVTLQMERLTRSCRLKGVNVFEFLEKELKHKLEPPVEVLPDPPEFKCPVCEKVFRNLAALTGHGPHRCKNRLNR